MKVLLFLLFAYQAYGCDLIGGPLSPVMKKKLDEYDKFIKSLQNNKHPLTAINKRIQSKGILLDANIPEKLVKNFPSSFSDNQIYESRTMFLKSMKLPPGLSNDLIYEVSSFEQPKILRSWQLPANSSFLGIRGNEILHRTFQGVPCSDFKRDILLAVSPNGKFRAIEDLKIPEFQLRDKCPGMKKVLDSDYAACAELLDVKSRKKRLIIFQHPMT